MSVNHKVAVQYRTARVSKRLFNQAETDVSALDWAKKSGDEEIIRLLSSRIPNF